MEYIATILFGGAFAIFYLIGLLIIGATVLAASSSAKDYIKSLFSGKPSSTPSVPQNITPPIEQLPTPKAETPPANPPVEPPKPLPQKIEINVTVPPPIIHAAPPPPPVPPRLVPAITKQPAPTFHVPPTSFASKVTANQVYYMALKLSGLSPEDVDSLEYMEDDDPRIIRLRASCQTAYSQLTGGNKIIPPEFLPPYPVWINVAFPYTPNLYSYFLGNISEYDIHTDQEVIVYARPKKRGTPKRKRATVKYISSSFEPPPDRTNSPITLVVRGVYMASKTGKKYHDPCCRQVENVSNDEAIWFQTEEEALFKGFAPCKTCLM